MSFPDNNYGYSGNINFSDLSFIEKIELVIIIIVGTIGIGAILMYVRVLIGVLMGWLE
jgi:hypothetical protein